MRYLQFVLILMLSISFVGSALAEEKGDRPDRSEFRKKMLEEFDADGDGELSEDERATAREKMRGRHGKGGAKGRRGSKGKGGEGPPNPEKVFKEFDANGDGQLSREEFHKLAMTMRERHGHHGPGKGPGKGRPGESRGRRGGPPEGRGDRPGPPPEGRRDFDSQRPLQNPGDRPGPPRGKEGRRRGGESDGQGPQGHEGRRPPNPDRLFDHFDKNEDGQLSQAEFMELSQAVHKMRERFGREHGERHGRGREGRRGPPGRQGPGPKPPQPESDDGAGLEVPAAEDESV